MSRPTILEFEAYRIVDFGEAVSFEERGTDALGNEKWDNCLKERGERMDLPAGIVFGLLSLALKEHHEAAAARTNGQGSETKDAGAETERPPEETPAIEDEPGEDAILERMAQQQRQRAEIRSRQGERRRRGVR